MIVKKRQWIRSCQQITSDWTTAIWQLIFTYFTERVLLEKLTCSQLVKKFPYFMETRRFISAFTSARQLSLTWASSIQSMPPHPTSWRSILILSSHLRLAVNWDSNLDHVSHLAATPSTTISDIDQMAVSMNVDQDQDKDPGSKQSPKPVWHIPIAVCTVLDSWWWTE